LRAASLLQRRYGVTRGASIRLEKRIPVAAGLGGGSADAAAALQGLMQLWQLRAHPDELAAIALELGADVPVCLIGRAAFVGGTGEKVVPIGSLPELGLVLINPRVPLSTKAVFMSREGQFSLAARWTEPVCETEQLVKLLAQRHNDLTRLCSGHGSGDRRCSDHAFGLSRGRAGAHVGKRGNLLWIDTDTSGS
jgi:4-diphosphocytidyl-2-C-methyl-D-erythritol kinase